MDFIYKLLFVIYCLNINCATCSWKFKDWLPIRNSEDIFLNSVQLLNKYNYTPEIHIVVTEDGYMLSTYRIPRKGPPVLLVHGIGDSSDAWLVLGPKHSLAYQLADAEFDVWLFNARGNRYSKKHITNIPEKKYWNFSYEEIGTRDVPATINYVLSNTQRDKLTYIGFSQGTTAFFVMCSLLPEYNKKIDHAVLLAPVAWLKYMKYPFIEFFAKHLKKLTWISEVYKVYEAFPFNERLNLYHGSVCDVFSPVRILCDLELFLNFGLQTITNLLPEKLPVITTHIPAGTASKVFFHYIQGYSSRRFQRYDYGVTENVKIYSSEIPPEYDVSLISVPSTLIASEVDWYSDFDDVEKLKIMLKTVTKVIQINATLQFSHLEFVYGARVNNVVNQHVLAILKDFRKVDS